MRALVRHVQGCVTPGTARQAGNCHHGDGTTRIMKNLSTLCIALCIGLSASAASGRGLGGMGMHSMAATGGAFGTSAAAPGTNSLGTALSSSHAGKGPTKGPPLGTGNPAVDREDAKVAKMVESICRGC